MNQAGDDFKARQREFAAHLRDPERNPAPADVEDRRMEIYRDLFFNNITSFLAGSYPVLAAQLGEQRWPRLVRDFYRDHRSLSPKFPQVSREFLNYLAEERGQADSAAADDPDFLYELAHFEWLETELKLAPDPETDNKVNPDGDLLTGHPVLSALAWAISYEWPVGEFSKDSAPAEKNEQPQHYLVYRDVNGKVIYSKLNLVSARLYQLLDEDSAISGQQALEAIAAELQHPSAEKVVASGLQILEKWRQLGVITGAA